MELRAPDYPPMSNYPGLLFPSSEFHTIGPIRLPIFKALFPVEARAIAEVDREEATKQFATMQIAKRIATDLKISQKKAIDMLSNASQHIDELYDYLEELTQVKGSKEDQTEVFLQYTTILMKSRGEVQLQGSPEYVRTDKWSAEDSEKVPLNLQQEIFQFAQWERNGWPSEGNDSTGAPSATPPDKSPSPTTTSTPSSAAK